MEAASPANRQTINNSNVIFYVSFGVCLILYLSTHLIGSNDNIADLQTATGDAQEQQSQQPPAGEDAQAAADIIPKMKRVIAVRQPTTPASYQWSHILPDLVDEYILSQQGCTPQDVDNEEKHKLPPPPKDAAAKNDAKNVMVIYVAVALLLMSLGATLVDFCKAKSELTKTNGNHSSRKKPSLTRRCSLADLTVLRHTRKELLRKESFCGMGPHNAAGGGGGSDQHNGSKTNWKINRPPLRLD